MSQSNVEQLKAICAQVRNAPKVLSNYVLSPINYILRRLCERIEIEPSGTAATDGAHLYVNPKFINCLDDDGKYFTFAHETLHVIEGDPIRLKRGEVDQAVSNIAFDLSINRALSKVISFGYDKCNNVSLESGVITPKNLARNITELINELPAEERKKIKLPPEGLEKFFEKSDKMSTYHYLMYLKSKLPKMAQTPWWKEGAGHVRAPGTPGDEEEARRNATDAREFERQQRVMNPIAGRGIIDIYERELTEARSIVNWREIIRQAFAYASTKFLSTWKRPHRRLGYSWPGSVRVGLPYVVAMIDVSGSISAETLSEFATELVSLLNSGANFIHFVLWADGVVGEFDIRQGEEEELKRRLRESPSGGTVIRDAFKRVLDLANQHPPTNAIIVLFTDGMIADINDPITKDLMAQVSERYHQAIGFYTVDPLPQINRWQIYQYLNEAERNVASGI